MGKAIVQHTDLLEDDEVVENTIYQSRACVTRFFPFIYPSRKKEERKKKSSSRKQDAFKRSVKTPPFVPFSFLSSPSLPRPFLFGLQRKIYIYKANEANSSRDEREREREEAVR